MLLLLLTVSLAPFAAAHHDDKQLPDVIVWATPIKDRAFPGEWLEFDLTIRNNKVADDIFRVRVEEESTSWSVLSKPMYLGAIPMLGKRFKTARMLFKDINLRRDARRPYGITIIVDSIRGHESYPITLPVYLLPGDLDYSRLQPNLTVTMGVPDRIDPRNAYSFKVSLENGNMRRYKDLAVEMKSGSGLVEQHATVDLDGQESKVVDFTVTFPKDQSPMEDTLLFSVINNRTTLASGSTPLHIVSFRIPFNQTVLVTESFLKRVEEYTLTNDENVREQQVFSVPMPLFKGIVSHAEPSATTDTVDNVRSFSWAIALQPGETTHVTIITNYRVYLYLAILIALGAFLYYMFRNPVTMIKQTEKIKTMEGGIAEMKIVLMVKNHSKTRSFQCQLHERLPHMINYLKREEHGVLPPDKVIRTKNGEVLRWLFDLEPEDERIVMYYVKTKLSVLGGLRLPPAVMRINYEDTHVTAKSNELDVTTE